MSAPISTSKKDKLTQIGCLRGGHRDWITSIGILPATPDRLLTTSRDKSVLIWRLERDPSQGGMSGVPVKRMMGHSHFISDIATTPYSDFCLTGSWDHSLRLWDLRTGQCSRRFISHSGDVLSVGISADNRQVVSSGRDRTVKLWNVLGQVKWTSSKESHTDWVSATAIITPIIPTLHSTIVSTSWDSKIKLWNLKTFAAEVTLGGVSGPILCMAISPDSSLLATGSKDHTVVLWDLTEKRRLWSIMLCGEVSALAFAPHLYRLCAAVESSICVFDLELRAHIDQGTVKSSSSVGIGGGTVKPKATSLKWSSDGTILFAGYTDGIVRCWKFSPIIQNSISAENLEG